MKTWSRFLFIALFFLPLSLMAWKMESGTEVLPATSAGSSAWHQVTLQQTYADPLVFALPDEGSGYNTDSPAALRIRNVLPGSFEIVQVEPQSIVDSDSAHAQMVIHYVVVEAGEHTFGDGTRLLAGSIDTDRYQGKNAPSPRSWQTVNFATSFAETPVLLSAIQTLNNEQSTLPGVASAPWMTVAHRNVTSDGFQVALERAETSDQNITGSERIAYMVLPPNVIGALQSSNCSQVKYETMKISRSIGGWQNTCPTYNYLNTYTALPNVIGSQNSRNGGDGGWLRRCDLHNDYVGLTIDEDQSADTERSHTTEEAGLIIFEKDFVYDSDATVTCTPVLEYRMDECFWTNGANSIIGDVKDSSVSRFDATSSGSATVIRDETNPTPCNYGGFLGTEDLILAESTSAGDVSGDFTVSFWMKSRADFSNWAVIMTKTDDTTWDNGWGFVNPIDGISNTLRFFVNAWDGSGTIDMSVTPSEDWVHVVGTYDNTNLILYKNGVVVGNITYSTPVTNSSEAFRMAKDQWGSFDGYLDEVKFWNRALDATEVDNVYTNELAGKSYDGNTRICSICDTSISEKTWEFIGIPAESRGGSAGIQDVFADDFNGSLYADKANGGWIVFKRVYDPLTNNSAYAVVDYASNEAIEFGQGYWLASETTVKWDVDSLSEVDYNATCTDMPASTCVSIPLTVPSSDGLDGSGPYRYNMTGFVGKTPVDWKDCRFDINGTRYTPSAAHAAGYINKTVWQYAGGAGEGASGQVVSSQYSSCDDVTPGGCKLLPFKGFWVELNATTVGSDVDIIIPGASSATLQYLTMSPEAITRPVGLAIPYIATGHFSDGTSYDLTEYVTWESSNTAVASIDVSGVAKTLLNGSTIIKATFSGVEISTTLNVNSATLSTLAIAPQDAVISVGESNRYVATATYSNNQSYDVSDQVSWNPDNTSVITVESDGTVNALAVGNTQMDASFEAQTSNRVNIKVVDANLQSIVVEPINVQSAVGVKIAYRAIGFYDDNTIQELTDLALWTSSRNNVARFDEQAVATTRNPGVAQIRATYDGVTSSQVPLTVTSALLTSLQITPANLIEPKDTSGQLLATGYFDDGSSQDVTTTVTWVSSNETIFTVEPSGIAHLLSEGEANVTASIGAISDISPVTVTDATLEFITLSPVNQVLSVGTSEAYVAVGHFSDNSTSVLNSDVVWSVSDNTVASIDTSGVVSALSAGSTEVNASHLGVTGTTLLTVTATTIDSITIIPEGSLVEPVGTSGQLEAIGTRSDGTTQNITNDVVWRSQDSNAVFVSNSRSPGYTYLLTESPPVLVTASLGTVLDAISIEVIPATLLAIQITPLEANLPKGLTLQYSAKGVYDNGQITSIDGDVTWSSSNTSIATIEPNGLAEALLVGDVNISATLDGVTAKTSLHVTSATIQSLEITPPGLVEPVGTSGRLTATAIYSDNSTQTVTEQVSWSSSKPDIATVVTDSVDAGLLYLLSEGNAIISATLETSETRSTSSGLKSDSISVEVVPAVLERLSIEPVYQSISKGATVQYNAIGYFSNGAQTPLNSDVSWSSSDSNIAQINEAGLASGVNAGNTLITATYNPDTSKSASALLNVTSAELLKLDVEPKNAVIDIGATIQLTCLAFLTDGTAFEVNDHVIWESSAESVAIVENGLATGKEAGDTTISASWHDPDTGINYNATAVLSVLDLTLTEVIVYADKPRLSVEESSQFTAVGIYADGLDQIAIDITEDVIWSEADDTIASVSNASFEKGLVTGNAIGETDITATLNGFSDITPVTVTDAQLLSISVEPISATVALGLTKHFTALGHYDDGSTIDITTEVNWASTDESVAKVESTGRAVSLSVGSSNISASTLDSVGATVVSNSALFTVSDSTNITLNITPLNPTIAPLSEQQFRAILTVDGVDDDISDACIWGSSDTSVAIVSNDVSTAGIASSLDVSSTSSTVIKAVYKHRPNDQNYETNTTLTVRGDLTDKPSSVRIEPANPSIAENETLQLSLIGVWDASDGGPYEQNLTTESQTNWQVDDKQIVNVTKSGLATGKKAGITIVTGKYKNVNVDTNFTVTTP